MRDSPSPVSGGHNAAAAVPTWKRYVNGVIANELSALTKYYDGVIRWHPGGEEDLLLDLMTAPVKAAIEPDGPFPDLAEDGDRRTAVLMNGVFNHSLDIQGLLEGLRPKLSASSRVLAVLYNPYLAWLYRLATRLGIRRAPLPRTFITRVDLENIARLAGFSVARLRPCCYFPWRLAGAGDWLNRLLSLVPLIRWAGLVSVAVLRPARAKAPGGLSCVIPARNERGNIENALRRFPDLGTDVEIVFVEGHSSDGTWEEIERVAEAYKDRFRIQAVRQTGEGKADAVRLGFSLARMPVLAILDADLTVPPETLGRFYRAYCDGLGDFVNGSRLVYPMETGAMNHLNRLGNVFFAKALSWVLDTPIGDSLCGTKLFSRRDYERMKAWRADFGDADPFGDFELLFPAAALGLGIIDVPVSYRARAYGSTNIRRFRDGWLLLKMTLQGLLRVKMAVRRRAG